MAILIFAISVSSLLGIMLLWLLMTRSKQLAQETIRRVEQETRSMFLATKVQQLEELNQELEQIKQAYQHDLIRLKEGEKYWQTQFAAHQEALAKQQELLHLHFENLASKVLEQKSTIFQKISEDGIAMLLRPLGASLQEFKQKIDQTYQAEARERFALKQEIERIVVVNEMMSRETHNLTKALKGDVKVQGNWGEMILEKILDMSGLRKGEEYHTQGNQLHLAGEDGRKLRPDVVINLPGDKKIIIDAKVSLLHYEKYLSLMSTGEDDEHNAQKYLQDFIKSLQSHIEGLAGKKYPFADGIVTPEYVLMFFPMEGAYTLALQTWPALFSFAWERGVVVVGPTTLMATLKTIASVWNQERQSKFTLEIAAESGRLYDKLVAFLDDLEKVDDSIQKLSENFTQAMGKLQNGKGNIISRAETIRRLGAKAAKQIPEKFLGGEAE